MGPLAAYVQRVMDEDDLTLDVIANRAGLSTATIGAYSRGSRAPAEENLKKLAKGLRRPELEVFEAAGRLHPKAPGVPAEIELANLIGELTPQRQEEAREFVLFLRRQDQKARRRRK